MLEKSISRRARYQYLLALTLVALLVTSAVGLVQHLLSTASADAKLINISDQQRMLSQKVALYGGKLLANGSSGSEPDALNSLQQAVSVFVRNHEYILTRAEQGSDWLYLSDEQQDHYFRGQPSLDTRVTKYADLANKLIKQIPLSDEEKSYFDTTFTETLLADLDIAVQRFEKESQERIEFLLDIDIALWLATLLLLFIELIFIFRPMEKRYSQALIELTEEKDNVQESMLKAERANQAKSEFLASMSHELRTPLSGMFGMIDIAYESESRDKQRDCLRKASASGRHLLSLINDILDISRLEASKVEVEKIDFNLVKFMDASLAPAAVLCDKKGLTFSYEALTELPVWVKGDPTKLMQILNNLLGNAVKFTEKGMVSVEVGIEIKDGRFWLKANVTDSGIGISHDKLQYVFEKFTQADTSTTRVFGGTGLGLTISRELTELMGGTLTVESEEGIGSICRLELPLERGTAPITADIAKEPNQQVRFAIVDDLDTSREYLASVLRRDGFRVDTYASSNEIMSASRGMEEYVGIVVDIHMPGLDGFELVNFINAKLGDHCPPFIMVSAAADSIASDQGIKNNIVMKFVKPIDEPRFIDSMRMLASQRGYTHISQCSLNILLAEDEDINAEIAQHILHQNGYSVTRVCNGNEAVKAALSEEFDVILMDINMPELDGLQASKKILHEYKLSIPIVALTANAFDSDKEATKEAGMRYHMTKPLKRQELLDTLDLIKASHGM